MEKIAEIFEKFENLTIISLFIVTMFFLSGINKILTFDATVASLQKKLNLDINNNIYSLAIIAVIILEILAPIIIVYYTNNKNEKYKKYAYYSVLSLIGFTILATAIYHPPNFSSYMKSIPFLSNVSLIGGLLLLGKIIKK